MHGRWHITATLLLDGTVLAAGGEGTRSAELYDPRTGLWTATGSMATVHWQGTASLMPDGSVVVAGGGDGASAELYDPSSTTWTAVANLGAARRLHTATLLPDGRLLVTGGYGVGGGDAVATAELYGPGIGN